jgi:hypothetical protein
MLGLGLPICFARPGGLSFLCLSGFAARAGKGRPFGEVGRVAVRAGAGAGRIRCRGGQRDER